MSSVKNLIGKTMIILAFVAATLTVVGSAGAQGGCPDVAGCEAAANGSKTIGLAIGAGLAIGLAGLGTGLAQKDIGAAAVGAVAEDASFLGRAILFIAIPETVVIFGFVIAILLFGAI